MEKLSSRHQALLKYLLDFDDFKPVKVFAKMLSCSDKTVRNDLVYLENRGIPIERVSGRGIRVAESNRCLVSSIDGNSNDKGLSTEQRRMKILFDLLEGKKKRLSIQSLSDKYFVSKTSIVNDLVVIDDKIAPYHLKLQKDVRGTMLVGSETNIRRELVDMINQLVTRRGNPLQESYTRIDFDTLHELEQHFGRENIKQVEDIIENAEKFLNYKITEPYYINLMTHILILISRIRCDKTVYSEFETCTEAYHEQFYKASKKIAQSIEENFNVKLNEAETFYIYRYLTSSSGISNVKNISGEMINNDYLQTIATDIINLFLKIFPLKCSFSQSLYKALILHLRPMLNRISYKIYIKNPILADVKAEFPEVMILLKLIMVKIQLKYQLPFISEDEIGYLAVYFQNAIEEVINEKNVVIVCSSGIGTSHLLKKRIKNYFPGWNIVNVVSAKQLENAISLKHVDLVVATVRLNIPISKPVAYVSAFFNEKDEKNIRKSFMQQFPKLDVLDSVPAYFHEMKRRPEEKLNANKCIAHHQITPALKLYIYQDEKFENLQVDIYRKSSKEQMTDAMYMYLLNKDDLTDDIIKEIYHWVLKDTANRGN